MPSGQPETQRSVPTLFKVDQLTPTNREPILTRQHRTNSVSTTASLEKQLRNAALGRGGAALRGVVADQVRVFSGRQDTDFCSCVYQETASYVSIPNKQQAILLAFCRHHYWQLACSFNGSTIRTYGVHTIELCLALQKFYSHRCLRCSWPLLGADFLRVNSLLVDLKGKRLVNAETYLSTPLQKAKERAPHLGAISISTDTYAKLLTKFPKIMVPNFSKTSTKHQVEHYITTKGPSSACTCTSTAPRQAGDSQG